MDDAFSHELIRDLEQTKARVSVHEAECVQRYARIEENQRAVLGDVSAVKGMVEKLASQGQHAAWSANWKAWAIAAVIGGMLLSGLAWCAGQLYALEPLRVSAAQPHK